MKQIDFLLNKYGESHQNATNKLIHWICVPTILFSLLGMIYALPFPVAKTMFFNWASVILLIASLYYLRLSIPLFFGFLLFNLAMVWALHRVALSTGDGAAIAKVCLIVFVIAWIGQFIGHKIEGKKPSFFEDVQYLLVGPAWLMHFIYKKLGIKYA